MARVRLRLLICLVLGAGAGVLCGWFAEGNNPGVFRLESMIFWAIFTNRLVLGLVVFLGGYVRRNPLFGTKCRWWLRGPLLGAVVSVSLGFGAEASGMAEGCEMTGMMVFWATVMTGVVYGFVIDGVATALAGEVGKEVIKK